MAARRRQIWRPRVSPIDAPTGPYVRGNPVAFAEGGGTTIGSVTLPGVLPGSTILVFVSDVNFNGTPGGTGAPYSLTVADGQGTFPARLDWIGNQYDLDALQVYARKNVTGGDTTVTCTYTTNQWHTLVACEIAGVGTSPTITTFGTLQVNPAQTADAITASTSLGSSPALLVGISFNSHDQDTSDGYPAAGTGFTNHGHFWNWAGRENTSLNDTTTLESRYLVNPGTAAVTFTPRAYGSSPDNFMTFGVAFQ